MGIQEENKMDFHALLNCSVGRKVVTHRKQVPLISHSRFRAIQDAQNSGIFEEREEKGTSNNYNNNNTPMYQSTTK